MSDVHLEDDLEDAFGALRDDTVRAMARWCGGEPERVRVECALADLIHHLCHAICCIAPFDAADDGGRVLAREAYLSTLAFIGLFDRLIEDARDDGAVLRNVRASAVVVLDVMTPSVSEADIALRRLFVDGARDELACAG
jgi:hypothetical protein